MSSPVATAPWEFSTLPDGWRVAGHRNIAAGALAAILSVPLAMGLGALALAPLGPAYVSAGVLAGLYGAGFLGLVAVLAGARGVAIYAPRSLVSFMIAAVCAQLIVGARWLPNDDPDTVLAAVFLVCTLAGGFQLAFALLHLSRVVKFIPTPVMAGFQNAASIIIGLSQIHVLLGLSSKPAVGAWTSAMADIKPLNLAVGIATLALVFHGARIARRVPPLLTGLVGGSIIYYALVALGYGAQLGHTIGAVPVSMPDGHQLAGIMTLVLRPGFLEALPGLLLGAMSIAIVASLDVLISAKVVENFTGHRGNSTRELLCIGTANTVAPLLGGIAGSITLGPTTASFKSGARNSLALFVHAVLFLAIVPVLAPVIQHIPLVVIGALVLHAGTQLFDRWTLQLLRRVVMRQAVNWGSILIDLLVIGLVTGVAVAGEVVLAVTLGMAIAVIVFTLRMSRGVIRSQRYGDEIHSRRTRRATDIALLAEHGRRILAIELEGPLFFASAEMLHNCIDNAIAQQVRYVILDVARVNEVDSTGARIVLQTYQRMRSAGVHLLMCGHDEHAGTASLLADHSVAEALTAERLFPDLDRALDWCENHLLQTLQADPSAAGDHAFELLDIARGLGERERNVLRAALLRREFEPGSTVFAQEEPGDALYVIAKGSASVRLQDPRGRERRLVSFSAGTVFGEMALLDQGHRSATVVADEPLACYVLERSAFDTLATSEPRLAVALLANLGRELSLRMRRANRSLVDG